MKTRSRHSRRCALFERPVVRVSTSFIVRLLILPPAHDCKYVNPEDTRAAIKEAVQDAIHDSPCVLINTTSGRILHKTEQASVFESLPTFNKLISSMTTHIDRAQIKQDVAEYYRYGMFSHKWEASEPLFKEVVDKVVYELDDSLTHHKLKTFCKIIRNDGLNWAWSDTCCINQEDPTVLQEALISMFKWYEGSALTVVYLRDVPLRRLVDSIWNQRAWTLQEYHASKVVRFYNRDWSLYKNINVPNHKDSPEILAEMEEATGISSSALVALRPGLQDIRKKLRLASTRQSTRVEDAAYSLFGIFSVSLSAVYGEGNEALGRLLAQLLMSSGDTSVLAWTGRPGGFNSCLPAEISVFNRPPTSHIPLVDISTEMDTIAGRRRDSALDLTSVIRLYDRLDELPVPSFLGKRLKLSCLTFKLGRVSVFGGGSHRIFRAQTAALGVVEIKTEVDLSRVSPLYLIHPWIDFLLDRQPVGSAGPISVEKSLIEATMDGQYSRFSRSGRTATQPRNRASLRPSSDILLSRSLSNAESLRPPSTVAPMDKEMRAFRAIARLRQLFGALLLTSSTGSVGAYKRVAPESLITVQVEEITPAILEKLIDNVHVLDVL